MCTGQNEYLQPCQSRAFGAGQDRQPVLQLPLQAAPSQAPPPSTHSTRNTCRANVCANASFLVVERFETYGGVAYSGENTANGAVHPMQYWMVVQASCDAIISIKNQAVEAASMVQKSHCS